MAIIERWAHAFGEKACALALGARKERGGCPSLLAVFGVYQGAGVGAAVVTVPARVTE